MNKLTVAICYPRQENSVLLEFARSKARSFGLRTEILVSDTQEVDAMGRTQVRLPRGFDLVVILCDNTRRLTEYVFLGHFNHVLSNPWATCVMAVCSATYKGFQPTLAIESGRYLGHFTTDLLPQDFEFMLMNHRKKLHDCGLSEREWKTIQVGASESEWKEILAIRDRLQLTE